MELAAAGTGQRGRTSQFATRRGLAAQDPVDANDHFGTPALAGRAAVAEGGLELQGNLFALRAADPLHDPVPLGAENRHVGPGSGSSVPVVLAQRTRRSRFSDKLVELVTGRFTQHDFERWGRVWWHRMGEMAGLPGEHRNNIQPLLAGRPSDLAKEASSAPEPPFPAEIEYVAGRDFRLVHFGGYALVIVPVPAGFDPLLTARVARERFSAAVSLAVTEGEDLILLGADDVRGRRGLDLGAMVGHLAAKHAWVEALRDEDHVARLRVHDLATRPERLEELIGEVAMGRSILEG